LAALVSLARSAVTALPWATSLLGLLLLLLLMTRLAWIGFVLRILTRIRSIGLIHLQFSLDLPAGHFVRFRDAGSSLEVCQ
jgi:hypothetical protein